MMNHFAHKPENNLNETVEGALVSNLFFKKKNKVNTKVNQMDTIEIEEHLMILEEKYSEALTQHADVHALSEIWRRIKELKEELNLRKKI